jgi:sulfur-carrier protein adenylyltransferase/sulfurtransferase
MAHDELARYARHIQLENVGLAGQIRLSEARVLCVGAGGLGSPLLLYLAAAGVGVLGIADADTIQLDNLHRQILYQTQHIGKEKIRIAKEQLNLLNPGVQIRLHPHGLQADNAAEIIAQYDVIADCSDNFKTRYLINDNCFVGKKPFISASISKFSGQCVGFSGEYGPCYRCLFPQPSLQNKSLLNCGQGGVLGVLPGILGSIQATEILKWILQIGNPLVNRLLTVDALTMRFNEFNFQRDPQCQFCQNPDCFNL